MLRSQLRTRRSVVTFRFWKALSSGEYTIPSNLAPKAEWPQNEQIPFASSGKQPDLDRLFPKLEQVFRRDPVAYWRIFAARVVTGLYLPKVTSAKLW